MRRLPHSPEQWRALGCEVRVLGRRLFVADLQRGPGRPILALHGFPTCSYDWSALAEPLAQGRRLIAPDLLGYGYSEKPFGPYTLAEQADLVLALLRELGLSPDCELDLLCHDMGDTVGCELLARRRAARAGPRFTRVAMLNGGILPELHRPILVQRLLRSPLRNLVAKLLRRGSFGRSFASVFGPGTRPGEQELDDHFALIAREEGLRNYPALSEYQAERVTNRARWVPALTELEVPLRLIWGELDPVAVWPIAERIRQLRPATQVVRLRNIGHYPQLESPAEVLSSLLEFFAG